MRPLREPHQAHTEYSYWLLPATPFRAKLRPLIEKLAVDYDAVAFEPHVTLYCGKSNDHEANDIAKRISTMCAPIKLIPSSLNHTKSYTKTLYIHFHKSEEARAVSEAIKCNSLSPSDYVFDPHLSLLYKHMESNEQARLCHELEVPRGAYEFDRLKIIETEIPLARAAQIRSWRTVFEHPLQG